MTALRRSPVSGLVVTRVEVNSTTSAAIGFTWPRSEAVVGATEREEQRAGGSRRSRRRPAEMRSSGDPLPRVAGGILDAGADAVLGVWTGALIGGRRHVSVVEHPAYFTEPVPAVGAAPANPAGIIGGRVSAAVAAGSSPSWTFVTRDEFLRRRGAGAGALRRVSARVPHLVGWRLGVGPRSMISRRSARNRCCAGSAVCTAAAKLIS